MLLLENKMRRGPASVCVNRYVKQRERKIVYGDNSIFYGRSMSQYLTTGYFTKLYYRKKNNFKY